MIAQFVVHIKTTALGTLTLVFRPLLSCHSSIGISTPIALNFPADGGCWPVQLPRDRCEGLLCRQSTRNLFALLHGQVPIPMLAPVRSNTTVLVQNPMDGTGVYVKHLSDIPEFVTISPKMPDLKKLVFRIVGCSTLHVQCNTSE